MIAGVKQSIDETSIIYDVNTTIADIANEAAATRKLNKVNDRFLESTKIRLWLKALDYKSYLTKAQRDKILYALIDVSKVNSKAIMIGLSKVEFPNALVGTFVKLQRKIS